LEVTENQQLAVPPVERCRSSQVGTSFIDAATLKHLQRELDQEVIDSEFSPKVCLNFA
jgi:hypothetical protein